MMNIIALSKSINIIKSKVYLNYILDGVTEMPCQYLLASLLSECVGNEYKNNEYRTELFKLINIKINKELISYNRNDCIRLIRNNLVELSENDYRKILEHPIIREIKNNIAHFDVDKYKNNIKNRPQLRKYGDKKYTNNKKIIQKEEKKVCIEFSNNNEYESELCSIWTQISSIDGFKECMPLVWQLSISKDMYLKLKSALTNYMTIPNIKKKEILKNYSLAIFVYVALWYRWEYNGNDNNGNALNELMVSITISEIWDNVPPPYKEFLYTSENGSNLLLYSLYVLGGFPLFYITSNPRFDNLFKEIHSLNNAEYQSTDEHFQQVIKCFDENNQAYKNSLISGSFNKYIKSLLDDNIYVHESDYLNDLVKKFKQLLDDGKRESIGNIFTSNYLFYYDEDSDELECIFKLKIGTDSGSLYVPAMCLQNWSLKPDLSEFYIGIETNTGIKSNNVIRFTRCNYGKDVFIGWGTQNQLDICLYKNGTSTINVVAYADYGRRTVLNNSITVFEIKEYFHVYNTGYPFEWSDKTNNKVQSSLIYKNERYELLDNCEIIESKSFLGELWNFVPLTTNVLLKEKSGNKELIDIALFKGRLAVTFKNSNRISYSDKIHSLVEYYNSDYNVEKLVLLLGKDCIKNIRLYPFHEGEKTEDIPINNNSDLKISCKQGNDWIEFRDKNIKAGKLRLKIQYKNYTCVYDSYYIPTSVDELARIDTDRHRINWGIPQNMLIYEPSILPNEQTSSSYIKQIEEYAHVQMSRSENGKFSFDDKKFDTNAKLVPFLLKDKSENGYLCINTWRARKGRELYSYGKRLLGFDEKRKDKRAFEIDYILKDVFEVRSINTDLSNKYSGYGIKISNIDHFYFNPFCVPGNEEEYNIGSNIIVRKYATDNKWIKSNKDKNIFKLKVGDKYKDEYQFYIWNMSIPDQYPIHVDSYYNEQEKTLYLKPDIGLWDDNNRDGIIIFQSLKGVKPNFYVAPQYINETSYPLFKNKRYDNKTFLRYYQIACEHNIYFSQFWPLQKLGENIDKVMSFIEYLFKSHHDKFSQNDYLNLQRFADEFVFDWLLLPYDKWKMLFKRYQDNIKVLFKHTALARNTSEKDYLITLLDSYFLIKPKSWKHVRNTTMKCIGVYTKGGVYKKNKEFALLDNDYSKRIEIMKKILSSETNIIRTLVEDINKQQKQ